MNDIARQLRAQIRCSTDPDYLERMAREAEAAHRTKAGPRAGTARASDRVTREERVGA
jgi:hypothetical protein